MSSSSPSTDDIDGGGEVLFNCKEVSDPSIMRYQPYENEKVCYCFDCEKCMSASEWISHEEDASSSLIERLTEPVFCDVCEVYLPEDDIYVHYAFKSSTSIKVNICSCHKKPIERDGRKISYICTCTCFLCTFPEHHVFHYMDYEGVRCIIRCLDIVGGVFDTKAKSCFVCLQEGLLANSRKNIKGAKSKK